MESIAFLMTHSYYGSVLRVEANQDQEEEEAGFVLQVEGI